MNQKARLAWELYLKMGTSSDSFSLLQVIANDCYKVLLQSAVFASGTNHNSQPYSLCHSEMFAYSALICSEFIYIWIGTRTKVPGSCDSVSNTVRVKKQSLNKGT